MNDEKLSRLISKLLRHDAIKDQIPITSDGWIKIADCINWLQLTYKKDITISQNDILRIVNNDKKNRYSTDKNNTMIKANQGHSIELDLKLKKINIDDNIQNVVHGTYFRFLDSIKKNGLSRMKRQYIHFALNDPNRDINVKSGMREDCEILVWVDIKEAMRDGYEFYISDNGVILSKGKDGLIHPKFLKIINR